MYCSESSQDSLLSVIQGGHTALIEASCESYTEVVKVAKVDPNITDKVNLIILFSGLVTLLSTKLPSMVIPAQSRC